MINIERNCSNITSTIFVTVNLKKKKISEIKGLCEEQLTKGLLRKEDCCLRNSEHDEDSVGSKLMAISMVLGE